MNFNFLVLEFLRTEIQGGKLVLLILGEHHHIDFVQAIRYHSCKPVVFSYKDFNPILYNNHDLLPEWLERRHTISQINSELVEKKKISSIYDLAKKNR